MNILRTIAYTLVIIGAFVWGMVGLFDYNLVASIFGEGSILARIIYSLVGIAAVVMLATSQHEECLCDCSDTTGDYY